LRSLALSAVASSSLTELRAALAPTGRLRVALFQGSPGSSVIGKDGRPAGVTYELAQLASQQLGVAVEYLEFPRAAEVFEAIRSGRADFTMTNASEARQREADFTPPLLRMESGYLVSAGSGITVIAAIDQAGVRVGVAEGGSSHKQLSRELKQASVVPVPSLDAAAQLLNAGELHAFASGKGILYEVAEQVPGSHVLPGYWGFENLGIALPKGRPPAAADWARAFADSLRGTPQLQTMVTRAGLRGTTND
jgi:polar amino acid transport system substrate-binding protein